MRDLMLLLRSKGLLLPLAFLFTSTVALAADRQINQISVEQSPDETTIRLYGTDLIRSSSDRLFLAAEASSDAIEPFIAYADTDYVEVIASPPLAAGQYRVSIGPNESSSAIQSMVNVNRIADDFSPVSSNLPFHEVFVDCDQNPQALDKALVDYLEKDRLRLNIKGSCVVNEVLALGAGWRHLWIAGEAADGSYFAGGDGDCANSSELWLGDPNAPGITMGVVAGNLWLGCITIDAPRLLISAYANGYVRFEKGVRTKDASQQVLVQIRNNSTFRSFWNNRIDKLVVRNNSLAWFQSTSEGVDIGELSMRGNSSFTCRFCTDVAIENARLRQGSNMTFIAQQRDTSIHIGSLHATQRSQLNIERLPGAGAEAELLISNQELIEDSVIYESVWDGS